MESGLKRRYRLAEAERFRRLRREGKSYSHRMLLLCVLHNNLNYSRCGITVSRRIGGAVVRNRVRRRIAEAVRLVWDSIEPGWDMVWVARTPIVRAGFVEVQAGTIQLLQRAGLRTPGWPPVSNDSQGMGGDVVNSAAVDSQRGEVP